LYDSEIAFTDEHIGKVFDELKSLGIYNNTLIILTADHGEEFLDRGDYHIGHESTLFQELIHVPLILKLPGNSPKKVINEFIGLIDVPATILKFAGLPYPTEYNPDGQAINIDNPSTIRSRKIISETRSALNFQSLIMDGWKLIQFPEMGMHKLFNLQEDPAELNNMASIHETKLRDMKAYLSDWNQEAQKRTAGDTKPQTVFSEEQKAKLKSLGYLR
jgi:arylsulfatase A-like enzyme